jgi:hypothetical protein
VTDVQESDDIMDAQNNPTAQHFEALMQQEDEKRKKESQRNDQYRAAGGKN